MHEPPACPVASAYAVLLAREPWHWFCTLTFSPTKQVWDRCSRRERTVERFHPLRGMHLEAADKAYRWFLFELNKTLYGKNWRRVPHGGVVWARGQEFHKSGRVHFHAVMAAPDCDLNRVANRYRWHELWYREFGRNQIECPRDQDDVLGYVSKYVAKDGEVDFSPNFGAVRPPSILLPGREGRASNPELLAPADDRGSTRVGHAGSGGSPGLSLTLPVRPQETQSQHIFSDESFFHT